FIKELVAAQNVVANTAAKEIKEFPVFLPYAQETYDFVSARAKDKLSAVYQIAEKTARQDADDELKEVVRAELVAAIEAGQLPAEAAAEFSAAYKSVTKEVVRGRILTE